ncbi:MAG: AraC family transcriptional regulator [Ferruginibacter sp.]
MERNFAYTYRYPSKDLSPFVESFWMLENDSDNSPEVIVLPDGRMDLFFSRSAAEPFHVTWMGIGTLPDKTIVQPRSVMFAISCKLPAAEYIFRNSIRINEARPMPADFWGFNDRDLADFAAFCEKASASMRLLLPAQADNRKLELFELIYASNGSLTVKELSEKVYWSSRQINRYFTQQFGISLKAYCSILRFRASFSHISEGKLFPQENFADQSHFIKEVKKLSGVVPGDLSKNKDGRFIQFSTLPQNPGT